MAQLVGGQPTHPTTRPLNFGPISIGDLLNASFFLEKNAKHEDMNGGSECLDMLVPMKHDFAGISRSFDTC